MSATKGQWKVDQTFSTHNAPVRFWETSVTSPSGTVAKACGATQEEAEANARIIATALKMRDACKALMEDISSIIAATGTAKQRRAIKRAINAIKESEGK